MLSALGTVLANATVVLCTGLVGIFGAAAIAGYGMASRLDYLLIPLLFALGTASVTMVGTNVGAGQIARARRIAWTAAWLSAAATGLIGLCAALAPEVWMRLFSQDAEVIAVGASYLRRAAPFYGFFGFGMALYFASQGAGKVLWPVIAGVTRLVVATGGGWYWVVIHHGSLAGLFWFVGREPVPVRRGQCGCIRDGRVVGWPEQRPGTTVKPRRPSRRHTRSQVPARTSHAA